MQVLDLPRYRVIILEDREEVNEQLRKLPKGRIIIDTETDGLRVRSRFARAHWVGLTPMATPNVCLCFHVDNAGPVAMSDLDALSRAGRLVGHNLRFDLHALGLEPHPDNHDTMVLFGFGTTGSLKSLDVLAAAKGWPKIPTLPELKSKNKWEHNRIADVDPIKLCTYLADDCVFTAKLYREMYWEPAAEQDMPTEWAVCKMERRGLKVIPEAFEKFKKAVNERVASTKADLLSFGWPADGNLNSPFQVGQWLMKAGIELKKGKLDKHGKQWYKTSKVALANKDREGVPEVCQLLRYRTAAKLQSGFADILPRWLEGDMLYPSVHTCPSEAYGGGGAETGRFSYSDPPLQQVGKRDPELGPLARQMFTSKHDWVHGADFDQVELRFSAAISGDVAYLAAFEQGICPHIATAASTLGIRLDQVTKQLRQAAKAVPFGLQNGMGAPRLAVTTGMSVPEAHDWIQRWTDEHPELAEFLQKTWRESERTEVATTLAGRRRVFKKGRSTLGACSTVISGGSAELMRLALVEAERQGHEPILSMHDELLGQNRLKTGKDLAMLMRDVANAAFPDILGAVDFTASGGEGPTWFDID